MRHDWTLLCNEVHAQDEGAISLGDVFSSLRISSPFGLVESAHSAIVQLVERGGEHVSWADRVQFDFRNQTTFLLIYILQNIRFAGIGTYELHVVCEE